MLDDTAMCFACSTALFLLLLGAWPGNTGELGVLENFLDNNCKVLPLGVSQLLKAQNYELVMNREDRPGHLMMRTNSN